MVKAATMILLSLALATILAFPIWTVEQDASSAPAVSKAEAEARFAVRYCYRQYRNQTDALACLARFVR
jgi:hypothetical protein